MTTRQLAMILSMAVFAVVLAAQGFAIYGVVQDGSCTGLSGVTVKVIIGKDNISATSDSMGRFVLSVPRPGRYELEASRGGFAHVRRSVNVKHTGRTSLRLLVPVETQSPVPLPPPPPPPPPEPTK